MRTVRILHDDEEFYLVDADTEERGRTITLLAEPDKVPPHPAGTPLPTVPTDRGPRVTVASWCDGTIEPLLDHAGERFDVFRAVLDRYLTDLLAGDETKGVPYFYTRQGASFGYSISPSHPHGLAVSIYTSEELADSGSGSMRTNNLFEFLARAANEGYAGAILDDSEPIYFCMDEDEAIRFMRLSKDGDEEIEETLLGADGKWEPLPQKIDLELYANTDACDRNMVRLLGEIPFHRGAEDDGESEAGFYSIEVQEAPGSPMRFEMGEVSTVSSEKGIAAIFHDRRSAVEFMTGRPHEGFDIVTVTDFRGLLESAAEAGLVVMLQPNGHRAAGGVFWLNGEEIILDSFSGLWKLDEESGFSRLS